MYISLIICVLCACVYFWRRMKENLDYPLPPLAYKNRAILGPIKNILVGPEAFWKNMKLAADHSHSKGGVVYFKLFGKIFYLITDPADAATVANECLHKNFLYDFPKIWFGDGLITASGPIWHRHRKLLNPAFSLPIIHSLVGVFNNISIKLIKQMEVHVGKGPFDHFNPLRKISLEAFCLGTYGVAIRDDVNYLETYMEAIDSILSLAIKRFRKFWLQNEVIFKWSSTKKKQDSWLEVIDNFSSEIIQKKKEANKNQSEESEHNSSGLRYRALLDLLLELSESGALTDKEVREEVNTAIGAGFETTSTQLMFTLMLLGAHQDIQDRVYQEISQVVGSKPEVDKDDIKKLVFTNAVILECFRVLPCVPAIARYVEKPVKLSNYTLRKNADCLIMPLCTNLDPIWKGDGDKFRPDRWLNDKDLLNYKDFAAFGLGKRICIGKTYALYMMKVVLVHFIRRYKVFSNMDNLKLEYHFLLKAVSGYEISIKNRH